MLELKMTYESFFWAKTFVALFLRVENWTKHEEAIKARSLYDYNSAHALIGCWAGIIFL